MRIPHLARTQQLIVAGALALAVIGLTGPSAAASSPGADNRLTHDDPGSAGYVSNFNLNNPGSPVAKDATLAECSRSRGRQNEPALAIDPRNPNVMVGSSNDYCGVYNNGDDADGAPIPVGPIWLGYYRSVNGGASFQSSLVPGYPGDNTPYAARAHIRTASSGDPVLAWDAQGRLFAGSESSDDPAGTKKTFGDVWVGTYVNPGGVSGATVNDGKQFARSVVVAKGSSAPNLLGKFNDKTSIEADRTSSACSGNVYFAYSRFTGNGGVGIYLSRSTDHGVTFSAPMKISAGVHDVQFPDISVTRNGHVYVTYRQFEAQGQQLDAVDGVKSADCGQTFSPPKALTTFSAMGVTDLDAGGGRQRDCGDAPPCQSGYTFFRADTGPRSTADQAAASEVVHVAYEAIVPGSEVSTGTTFGWADQPGAGGRSAIYYLSYNGASGAVSTPAIIAPATASQQLFPDLSVDAGVIHALWWDSRNDQNNDASSYRQRPLGNDAAGNVAPALDVYAATRSVAGGGWTTATRLSDVTTNPNYEQFGGRTVPFAGDYLWIDSKAGVTYGVWTDWRNTVGGTDLREPTQDETGADVLQCRTARPDGSITGDTCPRAGGLDQNIYGDYAP
ncbi:MAG: glycoside hydrolase [Actinomycetota bacterium]|nr:glycoside hydrolase [Actinomycetota bacterium]